MPLERFRSLDDARKALWMHRDDPRLHRRIAKLWEFSSRLTGELPVARGVTRFRTMEEANAHRQEWDRIRTKELQRRRAAARSKEGSPSDPG